MKTGLRITSIVLPLIASLVFSCGVEGMKSEKDVCEENAATDLVHCLFTYDYIQRNIFGTNPANNPAATNFARQVCMYQYFENMKCPDQSEYRPTRGK